MEDILGIHHVAILSHNRRVSSDFYERVLGLRQSENAIGSPQSSELWLRPREHIAGAKPTLLILRGDATPGPRARGEINAVSLSIPAKSSARWLYHLHESGIRVIGRASVFKEEYICFADPDGLSLSLVENKSIPMRIPRGASVALDSPILGFRSVELQVTTQLSSAKFLTDVLGFTLLGREGPLSRFGHKTYEHFDALDLLSTRKTGKLANSSPQEHVAWRVADRRAIHRLAASVQLAGFKIEVSEQIQELCTLRILGPEGFVYIIVADSDVALY